MRILPTLALAVRKATLLASAFAVLAQPLRAQQPRLSAKELSQVVSEVLRVVVPPTDSASRVSIADRKVVFDYARTMKAFQVDSLLRATLAVKDAPREGSWDLLSDCNKWGEKPCAKLGWNVYVFVEPRSIAATTVRVRANVLWAARPDEAFVAGKAPDSNGGLLGFSVEIFLTKSSNGEWVYSKTGVHIVGQ